MTLNRSTNSIKTYSGQTFTTEKFNVSKIINRVRLLTGIQALLAKQFLWEVIQDFCEKTWILTKIIQVGGILTEVDNDSDYYAVEIDLEDYADDLLVHDIAKIKVNGQEYKATKSAYLGDPTGSNVTETSGTGAYIDATTYIGATTYMGATLINDGELLDGYHYEIVDDNTIKIWPVRSDDVILIPVIFKTDTVSTITEIPYILENYYKNITSGVIAEVRKMPRHESADEMIHEKNYASGISKGRYEYARQYKDNKVKDTYFAI